MSFWREMLGLPPKKEIQRRSVYHAANLGNLFADFNGSDGSADADLRMDLKTMRNRSRTLARDDVYAKRFFELLKTNIVGEAGFVHQVKARSETTGNMDTGGNAMVENAWKTHGRIGNCTPDSYFSIKDLQDYCVEAVARDGEAFFQVVRGREYVHGIALHPFEADLVDETLTKKLPNGNSVRMGVEVDRYQRPVAYHVKTVHPGDMELAVGRRWETKRIPASEIIHVFRRTRAGQTRGEPWLHVAMTSLKMLNGHREAELTAARAAASKMGFFESDTGEEYTADGVADDGSLIEDFEAGTLHQLPRGVTFKPFDPSHAGSAFSDMQKFILHGLAVGLGPSYASLSGDMADTSYSSVRQGALDERDFYKVLQTFFREHFLERYYAIWLRHVMEFGYIPLPVTRFDKFFGATSFRARGWSWVDPQKEIVALVKGMESGILSPQAASAQYGKDFEETCAEWARDIEAAQASGLELNYSPFGPERAPEPQPQPQEGQQP